MLSLNDLLQFAEQRKMPLEKRRAITREYLQTLVLWAMQQTHYAEKLIFIGGTALRFFYNLQRFSEDLDFNYLGNLKKEDVQIFVNHLQKELKKENITTNFSVRKSTETYFHWKVYIQFPEILQYYGCVSKKQKKLHPEEKLSIQLDFQLMGRKKYPSETKIISNFGKRFRLRTTNLDMFLAEKSNAMLYRRFSRGRDFFDFMSLLFLGAKINVRYLKMRDVIVKNKNEYIVKIRNKVKRLDFQKLTNQLAPFLFQESDKKIMMEFDRHIDDLLQKIS